MMIANNMRRPINLDSHGDSCNAPLGPLEKGFTDNKENLTPNNVVTEVTDSTDKNKSAPTSCLTPSNARLSSAKKKEVLRPSSLQFCMQMNEPDSLFWSKFRDPIGSENSNSANVWDFSDSDAAPASSWSTLPNRTLLCRPLPMDVGMCTCVIVKGPSSETKKLNGGTVFSLYTNEGKGRQDRKLAIALCKRRNGKSVFTVAQSAKGLLSNADDSYMGAVTANLMGSKYHIWDQGICLNSVAKQSKTLLGVVTFMPTIATWTGSYRTMKVYIPKHQSMQLKNTTHVQHINGLPKDWEERNDRVHHLVSRVPHYNSVSKQYELDFRDKGRAGLRIQKSVKNFQLKLEESGKQTILQLGRVEKSRFVMDYRYPLTGYQAFSICLAAMDSKLCCTV